MIKHVAKPKNINKSFLRNKADKLWSELVKARAGYKCEHCGTMNTLNSHHIFSRSNLMSRFEVSNGICLCAGCHTLSSKFSAHKTPVEFTYFLEEYKGREWIDNLRKFISKPSEKQIGIKELQETIDYLKSEINKLK